MKQRKSKAVKRLFLKSGVYEFLRRLMPNPAVAILRYHAVVNQENNFYTSPSIALPPQAFENHVKYFTTKYKILSLDQVVDHLRHDKSFPTNSVVFTFDDGYSDNFVAAQTLHKYKANATFYITIDPIDRKSRFWLAELICLILKTRNNELRISYNGQRHNFLLDGPPSRWMAIRELIKTIKSNNQTTREQIRSQFQQQLGEAKLLQMVDNVMLNWDQVTQMSKMGMTIGSHTLTHLNLPNADPSDAKAEIEQSKEILEEKLQIRRIHFSYPNSGPYKYFDERIKSYVSGAGFESSTTSMQGFVNGESDLFALQRIRTVPDLSEVIHQIEWDRVLSNPYRKRVSLEA